MKSITMLVLFKHLQDSAHKAASWYDSNFLKGNFLKYGSKLMSRTNKFNDHELKLDINGTDIKSYHSITLLGVNIDNALNFPDHISSICKKHSHRVGFINRLRNLLPTEAKLQLFMSSILPHLVYCSIV